MLTWLRELAATVGTFDRSALEPGYALRCTAGVAIPLVIAAMLGKPALGVPAAIGAFITGFTSLQGVYRTRLTATIVAALGMSLTSFVGAYGAHSTAALVVAAGLAGYICGTLGQIGPAAATVALNSLVAFVLFSSQPLALPAAALQSALVLGGGLVQALLLLVAWPTARLDVERAALADVFDNLASYARAVGHGTPAFPPITPFATARQILADPQPFARSAELARFNRLLEDSEMIRKRLAALRLGDPRADSVAVGLEAIAGTLRGTANPNPPDLQNTGIGELADYVEDAALAAAMLAGGRLPNVRLLSQPKPGPYVENHIVWLSRDSLRFALVIAIAMWLGRYFAADRGYWIPMTAAIVLKPDFQTTFVRGVARIGGTLVGAVVASLVFALLRGHLALEVGGVLVATLTAYLAFSPNYALFTVAITSFVVLVLGMRGLPGTTAIVARVFDTLAGGGLAMVGYLVFPTWERKRTRALLADLLDAQRALASAILRTFADPAARAEIEPARTAVWQARTSVEASIDRTRHEPHRTHSVAVGRALRILAVTQRIGLATLALEGLEAPLPHARARALTGFAEALDRRMAQLATALRGSRRVPNDTHLSAALGELENAFCLSDDAQRFILERLRAYADATARLARLIGIEKAKAQA